MKHQVIIALGSNYLPSVYIQWASERLATLLNDCRLSRKLWTTDIKGSGKMYQNRLAYGTTELSVEELQAILKQLEIATGRTKEKVTIDLDLMQYDKERYHEKDWQRPYIKVLYNKDNCLL